jgi:hypothetical protein
MSTTWITVAKLAGPVAGELGRLFQSWEKVVKTRCSAEERAFEGVRERVIAREVRASEEYRPRIEAIQQDDGYRRMLADMSALEEAIESRAHLPPVVFFRKYVDPWTVCPCSCAVDYLDRLDPAIGGRVFAPSVRAALWSGPELALFSVADRAGWMEELKRRLAGLRGKWARPVDWFEQRQFYQALAEGTVDWERLLEDQGVETVIFLAFRSVTASWLDEEVAEASRRIPEWYAGFGPSAPAD